MILEAIRMLADALADDEIGVNALRGSFPRDEGDPPPPEIKLILDETRDRGAASGDLGATWPVLVVTQESPAEMDGERGSVYRDADHLVIGVRYVTGQADAAAATREALYTMRAVVASIELLSSNQKVERRKRNRVQLWALNKIVWGLVNEEAGPGRATGLVLTDWKMRESDRDE